MEKGLTANWRTLAWEARSSNSACTLPVQPAWGRVSDDVGRWGRWVAGCPSPRVPAGILAVISSTAAWQRDALLHAAITRAFLYASARAVALPKPEGDEARTQEGRRYVRVRRTRRHTSSERLEKASTRVGPCDDCNLFVHGESVSTVQWSEGMRGGTWPLRSGMAS